MPPALTIFAMPIGIERPELVTRDLSVATLGDRIDPFLVISQFDMRNPLFPPHPHAGFSVATYIFPESEIGFWNQDTLGHRNPIAPGSLHVTVAGTGVLHEETVARSGRSAKGFQIWMDHAAADREVAPTALHLAAPDVPTVTADGVVRRVLLGSSAGVTSPISPPFAARIVDVELQAGAVFDEPVPKGDTAFAVIREGTVETAAGPAGPGTAVFADHAPMRLTARTATRLTLFGGPPLRQPVITAGSFAASTEAQARSFRTRFVTGGMGRLTAFDQSELDRLFDQSLTPNGA